MDTTGLPGGDLVQRGLQDLAAGTESVLSLLVVVGAPRLRRLGLPVPDCAVSSRNIVCTRLAASDSDSAHSRYNALIRTLVSFVRAAECVS